MTSFVKNGAPAWTLRGSCLSFSTVSPGTRSPGMLLLAVLLFIAAFPADAGTVETLDGSVLCGRIDLESPDAIQVTPTNAPPVRVALSNLLRADFTNPTNLPTSARSRLKPPILDEERGALPEPWLNLDLGRLEEPGSAMHYRGQFTIESSRPIRGESEEGFHFVYQPLRGDGEIIARVASITPRDQKDLQAKAGVVMRASLDSEAFTLMMFVSGGGGAHFRRGKPRGISATDERRPDLKPPYWVKLRREGATISGSYSTDGRRWLALDKIEVRLPDRIFVGLAATSRRRGSPATAEFDHVTARSLEPREAFTPRIVLRDGTIIADHFRAVDDTAVTLSPEKKGLRVLTRQVARLEFRPLEGTEAFPAGRGGVLLNNGDFVDGDFQCVTNGRVLLGSVLFGRRSLEIGRKVAAVVLREASASPAAFEVRTFDGSVWRARATQVEGDGLIVETALLGRWRIPTADLRELVSLQVGR
jgi:hypothetical protein